MLHPARAEILGQLPPTGHHDQRIKGRGMTKPFPSGFSGMTIATPYFVSLINVDSGLNRLRRICPDRPTAQWYHASLLFQSQRWVHTSNGSFWGNGRSFNQRILPALSILLNPGNPLLFPGLLHRIKRLLLSGIPSRHGLDWCPIFQSPWEVVWTHQEVGDCWEAYPRYPGGIQNFSG